MKNYQIAILIFLVAMLAIIIALVYDADTYSTFEEAKHEPGREFHIIGELEKNRHVEEKVYENTLLLTFYVKDRNGEVAKVNYMGAKPTDFEKSEQIVMIGKFKEDVFIATSLLIQCPSKYTPEEKFKEREFVSD